MNDILLLIIIIAWVWFMYKMTEDNGGPDGKA